MNIELPKDAEGRDIPLDTTSIFGVNGKAYNIACSAEFAGFLATKTFCISQTLSTARARKSSVVGELVPGA